MEAKINRVASVLLAWRAREERFIKLFPDTLTTNRPFMEEKLRFLDRIDALYKSSKDPDEKLTIRILAQERANVEKELYPNLFRRLLRRIWGIFDGQKQARAVIREAEISTRQLNTVVRQAGFRNLSAKIDEQIQKGQDNFHLPVSYYVDEKQRADYRLHFQRDNLGKYQLENYKVSVHVEGKPELNRSQTIYPELGTWINALQSRNLLSGRAIKTEHGWKQLDLKDKDHAGNYRVKEFRDDSGFDLEDQVEALPIDANQKQQLMRGLSQGNQEKITISGMDGQQIKLGVTADPQKYQLQFTDEKGKSLSLETALARQDDISKQEKTVQANDMGLSKIVKLHRAKGKRL